MYMCPDSDDDFELDEEQLDLSELHLAAKRGDAEAVERLLISSVNRIDERDAMRNTPLHVATQNGHVGVMALLLRKNADADSGNVFGQTSLHLAAKNGQLAAAQFLLNRTSNIHVTDNSNKTPIHIAAMHGQYELVQFLISYCALLICCVNKSLHLAANYGHAEVVQLLLSCGKDVDTANVYGNTLLHFACGKGHLKVVEVFFRSNADANIRNDSGKISLHIAAEKGYAEIVKTIIDHKGEVNAVDRYGDTALHLAARSGHAESCRPFHKSDEDVDTANRYYGKTPLHLASGKDHLKVVEILFSSNASANIRNASGWTPLHVAANGGYSEMVKEIVNHQGEVNTVDRNGDTPLQLASKNGHLKVVDILMNIIADSNKCSAPDTTDLHIAAEKGYTEKVREIIDHKGEVNAVDRDGDTALHLAAKNGHADIIQLLLNCGENVDVSNMYGNTPLHLASEKGHLKVVEVLFRNNAGANNRNASGWTPSHIAANGGYTEIVKEIRDHKGEVNVADRKGITPLQLASENGHLEVAKVLLRNNVRANIRNASGKANHGIAAEKCYLEVVREMKDHNGKVHAADRFGDTALHNAAKNGHAEIVQLLLDCHEDVDTANLFRNAPLHLASEQGHLKVVEVLFGRNAGANIRNASGKTPLHVAAENGHVEIVKKIIDNKGKVNAADSNGYTALHLSAKNGHAEIVQLLLNCGQNVDSPDLHFRNTPLHFASDKGHLKVVEILIRSKADANIQNASGKTPLHIAAEEGYADIVKRIIDHKGEVNAVDENGDTPLHLASKNNFSEVVEVLLRNNANANIPNAFRKFAFFHFSARNGDTPLHLASEKGCVEVVKVLLRKNADAISIGNGYGNTALHLAAGNGHTTIVIILLNPTAECDEGTHSELEVNQVLPAKFEPSQYSIRNAATDVDQTSRNVVAESRYSEITNIRPSHSSAISAVWSPTTHSEIGINLILNNGNVNACNNAKITPLHLACHNGHTSIAEILLGNGATVDLLGQSEQTPFYLAAKNGHAEVSDLLLSRGLCDFVLTKDIQTPLYVAVKGGHTKVLEVILKHSRKFQRNANDPSEMAVVEAIDLLKSDDRCVSTEVFWTDDCKPLEIWRDSYGSTALEFAISSNEPRMVELLLNADRCQYSEEDLRRSFVSLLREFNRIGNEQRAINSENIREIAHILINSREFNANYNDQRERTPLHAAVDLLCEEWSEMSHMNYLLQLLLEKGSDFNMRNSSGETPLIIASKKGKCHVIQSLFDWEQNSVMKLDIDARENYGATALIKAVEGNHVEVVRLLLNHNASVNMHDNCGFTALHAAFCAPNRNWFDLHVFCKDLLEQKCDTPQGASTNDELTWGYGILRPLAIIGELQGYIEGNKKRTQLRETVAKLLLSNDKTDVNAKDYKGNTPMDLALKSSLRVTSATFKALENRAAMHNLHKLEDDVPIDVAMIDERGRNPLHRLVVSRISRLTNRIVNRPDELPFDCLICGILLRPEDFRHLAIGTDDKGRTPLHYLAMLLIYYDIGEFGSNLIKMLCHVGSNINAADIYGKTPLHYAEDDLNYNLLIRYGADETKKDKQGRTTEDLKRLRKSVTVNEENARKLQITTEPSSSVTGNAQSPNSSCVAKLMRRRVIERLRICSQSPRPKESSEEAIWKIWTENEPFLLNRRLSQLRSLVHQFVERLADGIEKRDTRFECQPTLVGSADEETKVVCSADFDSNFKLIKFSQLFGLIPHPLGPKGYFQLRRKPCDDTTTQSDEQFDSFFNSDQFFLTNEVNFRFKFILEEVLRDPKFWQGEHQIERYATELNILDLHENPVGLCTTVKLKMIYPIEDGEGGLLFLNISIDIVACVQVEGWWPEDPLPLGIDPSVMENGSTFAFDRPRFVPFSREEIQLCAFFETFARISFAPLESRLIRESSPLMRAAFTVCKLILYSHQGTTYQLKTCLLFCMEAFLDRYGRKRRHEEEITKQQLAFQVERIMLCFLEFSRHGVFPCYFMSSFKLLINPLFGDEKLLASNPICKNSGITYAFPLVYGIYLDLCPDDTVVDISISSDEDNCGRKRNNVIYNPVWKNFDRGELIRKLSSRRILAVKKSVV